MTNKSNILNITLGYVQNVCTKCRRTIKPKLIKNSKVNNALSSHNSKEKNKPKDNEVIDSESDSHNSISAMNKHSKMVLKRKRVETVEKSKLESDIKLAMKRFCPAIKVEL